MSPVPVDAAAPSSPSASHIVARAILHLLATRDDEDYAKCHPQPNIDLCEKPEAASNTTTIVLSILGGMLAFGTIATLVVFHCRRQRRDEQEWPKSQQELEDYGLAPAPASAAPPPRPKNAYQPNGGSNSGNKSGDRLPPPGRRDSLKSLALSIRADPAAYRSRPDDTTAPGMKAVEPASQL